jgi:hypothetical protein
MLTPKDTQAGIIAGDFFGLSPRDVARSSEREGPTQAPIKYQIKGLRDGWRIVEEE